MGRAGKNLAKDVPAPLRERRELIDRRLVSAISHPLRVEILVELARAPISPVEYSKRTGDGLSLVAYHFRALLKNECVEVIDERQRRGATEHTYRITKRALLSDEDFAHLPPLLCGGFDASILSTFMEQSQRSLEAHSMTSRPNRHLTWQTLKLDELGFERLMSRLMEVYEAAGVEQLAARERMAKSGEDPVYTTVGMFGFESPPPDRDHDLGDGR